jgi:hypothetical protein
LTPKTKNPEDTMRVKLLCALQNEMK